MHLLWSQTIPAPLRGLSLARERDGTLAWNGQDGLFLFNHAGRLQAQRPSPVPIAAACSAEDGSAYAVGGSHVASRLLAGSRIWLRAGNGLCRSGRRRSRWSRSANMSRWPTPACTLHLLDRRGHAVWQATTPRPLCHLAFVPEKPVLIGAADFGLVLCFGATGECLWRDGLVAHVGSLAVSGDGAGIMLACFGDGLVRYSVAGPQQQRIPLDAACHLAALSYAAIVCSRRSEIIAYACGRKTETYAIRFLSMPPPSLGLWRRWATTAWSVSRTEPSSVWTPPRTSASLNYRQHDENCSCLTSRDKVKKLY